MSSSITAAPRVFHFTFPKCGSQWVRDVINAPEVTEYSGYVLHPTQVRGHQAWPTPEVETLFSPVYYGSADQWMSQRQEQDKAVVVIRDPRDLVISWVFSCTKSHVPGESNNILREPFLALNMRNRLKIGFHSWEIGRHALRSWANQQTTPYQFITRYEKLISDASEFTRMFDFLGWGVPLELQQKIVHRLSFEVRSGRERGKENEYSHFRKGISGDWKNHFDRELGGLFEDRFPHLLRELGYEETDDWHLALPETLEQNAEETANNAETATAVELHELRAAKVRLTEQRNEFERIYLHMKEMHARVSEKNAGLKIKNGELKTKVTSLKAQLRKPQSLWKKIFKRS